MKKNAKPQVLALWQTYQNVTFKFPGVLRLQNHPFYILSACNPGSQLLTLDKNNLRTQKLRRYLLNRKIEFSELFCGDINFDWQEASFAIVTSETQIINLARLYEQNAVYWVDDGILHLVPILMKGVTTVKLGLFEQYCADN